MRAASLLSLTLASASSSNPQNVPQGRMRKSDIPSTGRDWVSIRPGLEFQPAEVDERSDPRHAAAVNGVMGRKLTSSQNSAYANQFIDGLEEHYDDYAQAWRLLGFYIDCNVSPSNGNQCGGDGNDDDNNNNNGNDDDGNESFYSTAPCQRYLMWAAYIDEDYAGGHAGEYQFYDRHKNAWDNSLCNASQGRCAKMDCHLKGTNFKLLGFFKEPNYQEWMEQVVKHEGVCIWDNDEYDFMKVDREIWPCQCTDTYQTDEKGNPLYYDTKPMPEGRISLGLYTDERCSLDYNGELKVADILQDNLQSGFYDANGDGTELSFEEGIEKWNSAFDAFKICQPCKAYDLGFNSDLSNSGGGRKGGDKDEDGNMKIFNCFVDADYTNVNQCMKFKAKTQMLAADFRDVTVADQQGHIVEFEMLGRSYGRGGYRRNAGLVTVWNGHLGPSDTSVVIFAISTLIFIVGTWKFYNAPSFSSKEMKEPLVTSKGVVA